MCIYKQDNQGQWRTYTEDNLKKLEEIYGQNPNAVCKMVNGKFESDLVEQQLCWYVDYSILS